MSQTANAYERPTWSLPNGNVPDIVANYYFRSDTPTGRSVETPPGEAVDAFRQLIRAGAIVPTNASAQAMAQSEGGIQNGDMSLFGVPFIDDLPGGMDASQWNALTARSAQQADERLRQAQLSGYFNGVPTLERQQVEQQYRLQEFQNATARQLADAQIRQHDTELVQAQQSLDDARRTGDLNRAAELERFIDTQKFAREQLAQQANQFGASLGEEARQFNTTATGYLYDANGNPTGSTLSREQQAFQQQQVQAELASNPRNYIQALMSGARGGLQGQAPLNGVTPTTGALGAAQQQTAFNAQPQTNAVGQYIPTNSFTQALLTGQAVPNSGNIQTAGNWWNAQDLQNSVDPQQWRAQDYYRGTPIERETAQSVASFAGYSPENLEGILRKNLPRFSAPTAGTVR